MSFLLLTIVHSIMNIIRPFVTATSVFITLLFALGLALTIKYAYIDQMVHYHTGTCYILDCSSTQKQCCSHSTYDTECNTCYSITATFEFFINGTNYTRTDWTADASYDYCNDYSVSCYYDDRVMPDSLRIFYQYTSIGGIIGIIILSICLFMMVTVSLVVIVWSIVSTRNEI